MELLLKNGQVCGRDGLRKADVLIRDGIIARIRGEIPVQESWEVRDVAGCTVLPGLVDVHVHFREPGFTSKETMRTGSLAAAHGGYTMVCPMPNLSPVPDTLEHLGIELAAAQRDACVHVMPYGSITMEEKGERLSAMQDMAPHVAGFSDDGRGVQDDEVMLAAMREAKRLDRIIAAHCEVNSLLHGGYVHDGAYAARHGHRGISSESEWRQIARDVELARKTGARYHVCHISTKESVEIIRRAKADGVDVSCETGPHYLVFCDEDLQEDGRFKMNPPLRSAEDRDALIEGLLDGTIDMIATDHAPHEAEKKSLGLEKSAMGVVGLETAFAVMHTHFVKTGRLTLQRLTELMSHVPSARFGFQALMQEGSPADIAVFDLDREWKVDPDEFFSMGRATPFAGCSLFGKCVLTLVDGKAVFSEKA